MNGQNILTTRTSETRQLGWGGSQCIIQGQNEDLRIVFHAHHDDKNIHPRKMHIGKVEFRQEEEVDRLYISHEYQTPKLRVSKK